MLRLNKENFCQNNFCVEKEVLSAFDSVFLNAYITFRQANASFNKDRIEKAFEAAKALCIATGEDDVFRDFKYVYNTEYNESRIYYYSRSGGEYIIIYDHNQLIYANPADYFDLEFPVKSTLAKFFLEGPSCPHKK